MSRRFSFGAVLLLVLATSLPLRAAGPGVTSHLSVSQIVRGADGREKSVPATKARAGALLEYALTYTNHTRGAIRHLVATLPIPAGTAYVDGSSRPPGIQASIDGHTYAAPPLKRREKQADGKVRTVTVPASAYRFLRWTIPELSADESRTLTARVRIQAPKH